MKTRNRVHISPLFTYFPGLQGLEFPFSLYFYALISIKRLSVCSALSLIIAIDWATIEKMATQEQLYESLLEPITKIEDQLFLGNRAGAQEIPSLRMHDISSVVQIQSFPTAPFHPDSFRYLCFAFTDVENDSFLKIIAEALAFMHAEIAAGRKVFVHCDNGVSRSGSVVTAYIMATHNIPFEEALQYVKARRPCVGPNNAFKEQLRAMTPEHLARCLRGSE